MHKQLFFRVAVLALFFLSCSNLQAEEILPSFKKISSHRHYSIHELTFESPVRSPFKNNNRVYAEVFLPADRTEPVPLVIILPGIAEPNKWIEHAFCKKLVKKGIAALLIELPYQFHRRPFPRISSKELFLSIIPKFLLKNFHQAIQDAHSAIEWARSRTEFNGSSIGILGISLGSLVGLVVMGSDPEIAGGVFILGGIDLSEIILNGSYTRTVAKKFVLQGYSQDDLKALFIPIEPENYIEQLKNKPVKLYNARWDRIIPKKSVLGLWDALPCAEKHWLFGGHYSVIIHLFWVPKASALFFSNIFFDK